MANKNGFASALEKLNTKLDVKQDVSMDALEDAANHFARKMKPRIPVSKRNTDHLRDALKVVIDGDTVKVIFEGKHYWYMVDKGHKKAGGKGRIRGVNFVKKTLNSERDRLTEIMIKKIQK